MEYNLLIWCVECTKKDREKDKYYPPHTFMSLTDAVIHLNHYKHDVKIDLQHPEEE